MALKKYCPAIRLCAWIPFRRLFRRQKHQAINMRKEYFKLIRPLVIVFILFTPLLIVFHTKLEALRIDPQVVTWANVILFLFSILNIYFQSKNINNPNLNAVIRGVMAAMFLKLFGLAAAAIIYLFAAGAGRSVNAVFMGMGLYIVY